MPFDTFPMGGQLRGLILPGMTPAEIRALWTSDPQHPPIGGTFILVDKNYTTPPGLLVSSDEIVCNYYRDNTFVFVVNHTNKPFDLIDNFFASLPHRHMSLIKQVRLDRGPLGTDSAVRRQEMCETAIGWIEVFGLISAKYYEKGEMDTKAWAEDILTSVKTNVVKLKADGSLEVFWLSWKQLLQALDGMNRPVDDRISQQASVASGMEAMK